MDYVVQNFSSNNSLNPDLMSAFPPRHLYQEGSSGAVTFTRNGKEYTLTPTVLPLLLLLSSVTI